MYKFYGKRLMDITLASFSLIFLSPILIMLVILIKIFDPGPIIFRQVRVGKDGKKFTLFKFRSMPLNTKNLASDKLGQVKFSLIGRIIRRTNLDEIPQLINIIAGDMSLVGPRPSIPSQTKLNEARTKNGANKCLPGLTGLAQICSFDGMSIQKKAEFDGRYSCNINFINDIKILIKTLKYVLKRPPVY